MKGLGSRGADSLQVPRDLSLTENAARLLGDFFRGGNPSISDDGLFDRSLLGEVLQPVRFGFRKGSATE